jgi:multidrug efflux system outer membrane protein
LLASAAQAEQLAWARYQAGRDSQITWLDAQRTLYSARQTALAAQRGLQSNRITLYKVLGGAISLERQDEPQRASD